jgi:hypothetical protein
MGDFVLNLSPSFRSCPHACNVHKDKKKQGIIYIFANRRLQAIKTKRNRRNGTDVSSKQVINIFLFLQEFSTSF